MSAPGGTLYQHRIYCLTENTWTYLWKEDGVLLTTCPTDPAHAVQAGSASIIATRSDGIVELNKEPGFETGGHVRVDHIVLDAPALGSVTAARTWPFNIAVYTIRAAVTAACVGCTLTAEAAPLTTIGTLTADAPIGTTVLSVSPTVTANSAKGRIITLQAGATVQECGRILDVNAAAGTITVETATTSAFPAAGPTLVKITTRASDALELALEGMLEFGADRSKAVLFPVGKPFSAKLVNPNAAPARLVIYMSYNY